MTELQTPFDLPRRQKRAVLSLAPLIDVTFILLIFFMLAARFGQEGTIEISAGGQGTVYDGPPRLVEVYPEAVRLNGVPVSADQLITSLAELTKDSDDIEPLLRDYNGHHGLPPYSVSKPRLRSRRDTYLLWPITR